MTQIYTQIEDPRYIVMARITMACIFTAHEVKICMAMACIVMAYMVTAFMVKAYIAMAYVPTEYVAITYIGHTNGLYMP